MSRLYFLALATAGASLLAGCARVNIHGQPPAPVPLRVATYNVSLYDEQAGGLLRRLHAGDERARKVAAVLQRVRPDIVLLNEFDHVADGSAADLFQRAYLEVPQPGGGPALRYRYRYLAPVNTGVPSGLDLDRNGRVAGATPLPGESDADRRERGNDAWGYGLHPGQYGMLVLSRHPIDRAAVRSFRHLRWSAMPGARVPRDPETGAPWYLPETWSRLRLSSKSHWDVPVRTPHGTVHLLAAHPTPPVFDGPEDRNGARNADEIRLWAEYLSPGNEGWLCDDAGQCGGLQPGASFVIAGDYNADPVDGDSAHGAITQLLGHPRVDSGFVPRSQGAAAQAALHALPRRGDTRTHTGDFGPRTGTLRLDYVLPSRGLLVLDGGVWWPPPGSQGAAIADGSDHRLVWLDLRAAPD